MVPSMYYLCLPIAPCMYIIIIDSDGVFTLMHLGDFDENS